MENKCQAKKRNPLEVIPKRDSAQKNLMIATIMPKIPAATTNGAITEITTAFTGKPVIMTTIATRERTAIKIRDVFISGCFQP